MECVSGPWLWLGLPVRGRERDQRVYLPALFLPVTERWLPLLTAVILRGALSTALFLTVPPFTSRRGNSFTVTGAGY